MRNRIQYQYDQINKCRLVCINGMYLLVDPEDLEFWAKEAGVSLSEEEKEGIADYLTNPHEPPDSKVVIFGANGLGLRQGKVQKRA